MSVTFHPELEETRSVDEDSGVNLSNMNAGMILDLLGLRTPDLTGACSATDFRGRILLAQALTPADEGRVAVAHDNFIDCGRRAGYTEDVLARLTVLAERCQGLGVGLVWG